jgi:acyl-coenzyme A thioesterase PaaI-like protein
MSFEPVPKTSDYPRHSMDASSDRISAARAIRRLGHAVAAHEVGGELFAELADVLTRLANAVESTPSRIQGTVDRDLAFAVTPLDGERINRFPFSTVAGDANPLGTAGTLHREGDDVVGRFTLNAGFEGWPGRANGGVVAMVFDSVLGTALTFVKAPAYTGRLTVSYLKPIPIGVEVEIRSRLKSRQRRKITIEGEARVLGEVLARAEGLFIEQRPGADAEGER